MPRTAASFALAALAALVALPSCRPPPKRKSVDDPRREFGRLQTLVFAGDTVLARRMHWGVDDRDAKGPLGALRPLFDAADISLVNLEGVISSRGKMQDKGEKNSYFFRGRPDLVRVLVEGGIDVVTLANNHAGDYGPDALVDALGILDAAGIQHVGAGATDKDAQAPIFRRAGDLVVAVIGADMTQPTFAAAADRPGGNYLAENRPDEAVARVRASVVAARRHAHLVFLTVHWGPNNKDEPDDDRRRLAHRLLDEAGVDAILGHSAHRAQGVEIHDGKPIFYDVGNLLWDYDDEGPSHRGVAFRLHFDRSGVRWIEALPVRLRKNRTEVDAQPAEALDRLAELCGTLGTTMERSEAPGEGAGPEAGVIGIAETPPVPTPEDPAGAPAEPERRMPGTDVLFPRPVTLVAAPPADATRLEPPVAFAGGIELLAWRLDTPRIGRHRPLVVTTWWRATQAVGARWEIFLHAEPVPPAKEQFCGGGAGEHEPGDWSYPTNRWRAGDVIEDTFDVRPFPDVPPGTYELFAGMWRPDARTRLHVLDPSRSDGDDRVRLGTFEQTADE
ncbi:MAG: CapA family protein [Deltaproteobacteria bacterium]|nr:CapA family protein [Deltaproteobacteria bacterium]